MPDHGDRRRGVQRGHEPLRQQGHETARLLALSHRDPRLRPAVAARPADHTEYVVHVRRAKRGKPAPSRCRGGRCRRCWTGATPGPPATPTGCSSRCLPRAPAGRPRCRRPRWGDRHQARRTRSAARRPAHRARAAAHLLHPARRTWCGVGGDRGAGGPRRCAHHPRLRQRGPAPLRRRDRGGVHQGRTGLAQAR